MKKKKKILKIGAVLIGTVAILSAGYVGYVISNYYRIPDNQELAIAQTEGECSSKYAELGKEYTILTYNVGFGAYSPDFTFFMDGGKYSWAFSKEDVIANITGAGALMKSVNPDYALIQEVDLDSTRSYHVNERNLLEEYFSGYYWNYAQNYDSAYLFYPFTQPHGKSKSGLLTYSVSPMESSLRRSLPIAQSFKKYLDLDRCYSITKIPVSNGKMLVIFNVHLSAYGSNSQVREGQIGMLCADMKKEIESGNYIICGGDFNHDLLNYDENTTDVKGWAYPFVRSKLPDGIQFGIDRLTEDEREALYPSARDADLPYSEESYTVTLDGFILSDNIEMKKYTCVSSGFSYSDHDPVLMQFVLK